MNALPDFVVVGILMRVEQTEREAVATNLERLTGVTTFEVGDEFKLGALIESATLEAAKDLFENQIEASPGVLAAWPIFIHEEEGLPLVELTDDPGVSFERSEVI